jgi:lysophospholipase L1-like esterase
MTTRKLAPQPVARRELLMNVALLVTATAFALFLSEVALRLAGRGPLYVSPERDRFWQYDPLLGWAHRPGQVGTFATEQFRTSIRINSNGLRDRDHSYERTSDRKRILVFGDSFAWGYGVEEEQRFSEVLEATMDVEVINAGVSGYSTDQELLWLRDEGAQYDFDLAILVMTGNDIGDNARQLVSNIYHKPQFVLENGQLVLRGYPVPETNAQGKLTYFLSQRSALVYFLVQRYFDLASLYQNSKHVQADAGLPAIAESAATEPFELTLALLDDMRSIATSKDAEFLIVATDHWWNGSAEQTYAGLLVALEQAGFSALNVEARPGFEPSAMLIPDDGHWNAAGHAFVAAEIQAFIEGNQLIESPRTRARISDGQ